MPELPDLAVFAENLEARLQGRMVRSVECNPTTKLNTTLSQLHDALCGTSIVSVQRAGKEMTFVFSNEATLFVHLMLKGKFFITTDARSVTFAILTLGFENESLVVSDPKKLVALKLNPTPNTVPDALTADVAYLRRRISERPRKRVKEFLLEQSILRGIGNAYADEILWQAKIAPKSAVGKIPDRIVDKLCTAITSVLTDAIEQIKKRAPEAISGEVRDFLRVHNPKRSESPTGFPILTEKVASRMTYFTEEQVLYI